MSVFFASLLEQVNFNFKVFTSLILSKIFATSSQCSVTICFKLVGHSDYIFSTGYTFLLVNFLYDPKCIK